MPEILTLDVEDLEDQKLHRLAKRVARTAIIAGEKAVAHLAEPENYPIPSDDDSFEWIFLRRLSEFNPVRQQYVIASVMPFIKAPEKVREGMYGNLAKVKLHTATPVAAQVKNLGLPSDLTFPLSHLLNLDVHNLVAPL